MISDNFNQVLLHLPRSVKVDFGDFIELTVVNKISTDRWKINVLGKNIVARTKVPLSIGSRLQAKVMHSESELVLQITGDLNQPIHDVLLRDRIPTDSLTKMIVDSLVAHNIALKTKTMMTIRRALLKLQTEKSLKNLSPSKIIRALVFIFSKRINLYSEGIVNLVSELINYPYDSYPKYKSDKNIQGQSFQRSHSLKGDNLKYNLEVPKIFPIINEKEFDPPADNKKVYSVLSILNHFKNTVGSNSKWVVLPIVLRTDTRILVKGNLRLLYDVSEKISKLVINAEVKDSAFAFIIDVKAKHPKMRAFFPSAISKTFREKISKELQIKMQNFGIKLDDTIREESGFDGFSEASNNELRRVINTIR